MASKPVHVALAAYAAGARDELSFKADGKLMVIEVSKQCFHKLDFVVV